MPVEIFDVAIVGYGPAGLEAASLLAGYGHSVIVIERWPQLYGQPRVATLHGEVGRILQAACDVDYALRNTQIRESIAMVNENGDVINARSGGSSINVSGYPQMLSVHQPDFEDALDQRVKSTSATVLQGWELIGLSQDEEGVSLRVRPFDSSNDTEDRTYRARYVIGADGARSTVRRLLGIEREGWPFRAAWYAVDVTRKRELGDFSSFSPDGSATVHICAPEGRARSIIPLGSEFLRFTFEVTPDEDHSELLNREAAYEALHRMHGLTEADVDVRRHTVYTFGGNLATSWRDRRVFLVGDAAHTMTPFLGEGGCSALRDSINLSWKLHLVIQGIASSEILDSYESERGPHVRSCIDGSDELASLVFTRDPVDAALRDEEFLSGRRVFTYPSHTVGSGIFSEHDHAELAKTIAPQGRIRRDGHEGLADEILGWGFQLLGWEQDPNLVLSPEDHGFLNQIGCVITGLGPVERPGIARALDDQYAAVFRGPAAPTYLLVRPDFLVFGSAKTPEDLASLVVELRARLRAGVSQPH